jgi:glutathione S-transferase
VFFRRGIFAHIRFGGTKMSGLKIYGVPISRAFRALWCANEIGLAYESVPTHFAGGGTRTPEFLAINPNGKVPAIELGDFRLSESMAIDFYLARKFDSRLIGPTIEDEALVLQWSFWAVYELERQLLTAWLNRAFLPPEKRNAGAADDAIKQIQRPLGVLENALSGRQHLLGNDFSLADLNVGAVMFWTRLGDVPLSNFPQAQAWLDRCLSRPACLKAMPKPN